MDRDRDRWFFLYTVLLLTIGMVTLRKGHGWMFFFGIFFPLLWVIGAMMEPKTPQPV